MSGKADFVQPTFLPLARSEKLWGVTQTSLDIVKISPRRVVADLSRLFLANRTPHILWGPVGARKTRTIEALARETDENGTNYQVITIQPSTQDPTIIHGIMYTTMQDGETVMKRSIPEVATQIVKYWEEQRGLTIIFADEMTTCMPAQQNALLGLLTHGKYESIDISPYISIVMAANPEDTVSRINQLSEAVINRSGHLAWYGDVDVFLEDWSSGFGSPERAPADDVVWHIESLLKMDPTKAFRGSWTPERLVPYDLFEHSERVVTDYASMFKLINTVFAESDIGVRHFYIIETARALMGNEWANRARKVCQTEFETIHPDKVVSILRNAGVSSTDDYSTLRGKIGDSMYLMPSGKELGTSQIMEILNQLVNQAAKTRDGKYYLAAWSFIMGQKTSGQIAGLIGIMVDLVKLGTVLVNQKRIERSDAIPAYVTSEVRDNLKEVLRNG